MYLVIESIYDGTWASGAVPEEIVIVDVLLETGWSWDEWCATPKWIQQVMVDTISARRAREQREQDSQQQQAGNARR